MIMNNPIFIVAIVLGVAAVAALIVVVQKKRRASQRQTHLVSDAGKASLLTSGKNEGLVEIPITQLPEATVFNENHLAEITDSTVISRLSALVPFASQTATKQVANNAAKALQGAELVKLDIPFSQLTKSKDVAGAARGYVHGGRGVAAQANLTKVDMTQIAKTTVVANGVANVMNVGSLVVGQYYMTEISDKLEKMNDNINKISDFQDREFKSRIISLISRVKKYSSFSAEIIENDETRLRTLGVLESIDGDATELLGQVNIEITDICSKNPAPAYQEYQDKIDQLSILIEYQNMLTAMLAQISKLTYLLGKGTVSSEMSYSMYNDYLAQSIGARSILESWHDKQAASLKIDLDKNRKSKKWFAALPGIVNEEWKYQPLAKGLADKIHSQSQVEPATIAPPKEIFEEDVEIIIRNGKYYYLHDNEQGDGLAV